MAVSYEELKVKLEQERTRLQSELAALAENQLPPEGGMGYSTHQADDATEAFDQAAGMAVRRNVERMLYEVERALARMDNGTYGVCRDCGKPIDYARLKAIPYARFCMDCARRHEEQ